jgi:hypothetical protein
LLSEILVSIFDEILLHLVEDVVMIGPGGFKEIMHFLALCFGPFKGFVLFDNSFLESNEILDFPHFLSNVRYLFASSKEKSEDGMHIRGCDHLYSVCPDILFLMDDVKNLFKEAAVVEMRVFLGFQHQMDKILRTVSDY